MNQADLLTGLSIEELEALADSLLAPAAQARLDDLLARQKEGPLAESENAELDRLLRRANQLAIIKSRARYTLGQTNGRQVHQTTQPAGSAAARFCGSLRWNGDPDELRRCLNDPDESSWSSRDV